MKKTRGTSKKKKIVHKHPHATSFPIVGIGASAGGLEADQELLRNLSAKPGMAIVFIMHLAPGRESMLPELLSKSTKMPVREIKNGMPIEVNHVYVLPPGTNVSIAGGRLKLNRIKDVELKRMPVDLFFRSLAQEQGNRGIGVILSGTATDGTLGAEAIKAEGGITFAQDEKSAKYGGMPQSAIAAGCVDFVLSPQKIARELERIAKHPLISAAGSVKTDKSILTKDITKDKGIEGVFDILRSARGLDFTHYKTTTISRRLSRRMVLLKLENLRDYIKFLRENKGEVGNLYEDLLLKVTSFFRDPKVFHALGKRVIPAILKNKPKGQEIRIWVPGCSSGEEAYSIAMYLMEALGNKKDTFPVRIFATDVSDSGIDKARRGVYDKTIKNDLTSKQLKRFFTKTGDSYKVSKPLRDMCIFSKQNVFNDPPFSNVDLISCRNLLIYFQPVLQKKVFHNFHYSLRPGGFLLLGNSESIGSYANLFKALDRQQRIFVKKYLSREPKLESGQKYYPPKKVEIKEKTSIRNGKESDTESLVERVVLGEYAPCGVLVDSDMEVVQFRGHTGRYLESAAGKPSLNLFKLATRELFQPLRTAIYKARGTKHTVKIEAEEISHNGRRMRVNITVIPVKSGPLKEEFFLVLFDEIPRVAWSGSATKARRKSAKDDKYVETLQKELSETKEYLQTVIEEQENVNEEVKTANEEILSSNEELLSTNEELETAKEELQSSNEELVTTNEELQNRNKEVVLLNNDLINLLSSINMPIIMMGTDLVIRRITPQAEKVLNVISSDIGRPISKIKLNVDIPDFEKILLDVIESLHAKTFEIKDKEGNWYSVYIRPYRTLDNKINGVIAIFINITEHKRAEKRIEWLSSFPCLNPFPVLEVGRKGEMYFINAAAQRLFPDIEKRKFEHPFLTGIMSYFDDPHKKEVKYFSREVEVGSGWYSQIIILPDVDKMRIYSIDITGQKQIEKELAQSREDEFRAVFDNAADGILMVDMKSRKFYMGNNSICRMLGYSTEEIKNLGVMDIHPEEDLPYVMSQFERLVKGDFYLIEDLPVKKKDGSIFYADINTTTISIAGKTYLMGFFRDTTLRKQAEDLLRKSEDKYRSLFVSSRDAIMTLEPPSWRFTSGNPATIKMFGAKDEAEFLTYTPWKLSPEHQPDGRTSKEKAEEMIETAMRSGSHFYEWTHRRANGEKFLANVLLSRVEQGEKVFLHANVRDVTAQKQMEKELKDADAQITTSEIKSKFTSMVSHELRSPLGSIKEGINLVLEGLAGTINDEQRDLLDTAKRNTDRLGRLINNVLDFQKMEAGKMEFDIRENDIHEAVQEVNKAMGLLAKEKSLNLVVEADNSIPKVRFDKDKIIQVLTNLVNNAIKYTEKGNVTIRTKQEDENTVHVVVQDTGIGIKVEDMGKLFRVFEQLDSTRDKKIGGTGLGLAISSEIILAHKGKIWAESTEGQGSAFHFTIPGNLKNKKKIGEILVEEGKITEKDFKKALDKQKE